MRLATDARMGGVLGSRRGRPAMFQGPRSRGGSTETSNAEMDKQVELKLEWSVERKGCPQPSGLGSLAHSPGTLRALL